MDKVTLIGSVCPPLDKILFEQFLAEYNSLENRFALNDWEPATLDGGQFCEAAARILYHIDSGVLDRLRSVDNCLTYVEDARAANLHHCPDRKSSLHTSRVIRTVYKFRSDRGAIHINPSYTANHIDSTIVLANCKWILAEVIRVFLTKDLSFVEKIIREIVEFDLPVIVDFDGNLMVQRTDLSVEEEILVLLHYSGTTGFSRKDLGKYVYRDPPSVTRAIAKLLLPSKRMITLLPSGNFRLTAIGNSYVLTKLADKLRV